MPRADFIRRQRRARNPLPAQGAERRPAFPRRFIREIEVRPAPPQPDPDAVARLGAAPVRRRRSYLPAGSARPEGHQRNRTPPCASIPAAHRPPAPSAARPILRVKSTPLLRVANPPAPQRPSSSPEQDLRQARPPRAVPPGQSQGSSLFSSLRRGDRSAIDQQAPSKRVLTLPALLPADLFPRPHLPNDRATHSRRTTPAASNPGARGPGIDNPYGGTPQGRF